MPASTDISLERCPRCGASGAEHARAGFCSQCLAAVSLSEAETTPASEDELATVLPRTALAAGTRTRFGDYELLEEIARGGMGVVYRARQRSLNRIVAIKTLLFGGIAGEEGLRRFRLEAASASALEHPNIVRILDVGDHDGQPFLAMDYVAGRDLARLVSERPLLARQAAGYVEKIARAVEFAHQHGVLHRDLKSSNVLIDAFDEPRVTDFGLAKRMVGTRSTASERLVGTVSTQPHSISEAITDEVKLVPTNLTRTGQPLGSPGFMPPEQAEGDGRRIGPASDVYGLGAILYHLLTSRPPFLADTFEATLRQVLDRDAIPLRQFNPNVPADLETICLKCLEKEPTRRYATAQGLAEDLERFLNDEPIIARSPSRIDTLRKFVRRNRMAVIAGISVGVMAVLGVVGISWQAIRATRAQSQAVTERANAEAALRFVREDLLAQADPLRSDAIRSSNRKLPLLSAIQIAAQGIGDRYQAQPLVEADIRLTIGNALRNLGEVSAAESHLQAGFNIFQRQLGDEDPRTLEASLAIAQLLIDQNKYGEASELGRLVLDRLQSQVGPKQHELTLRALLCLGSAALGKAEFEPARKLFQEVLTRESPGLTPRLRIEAMSGLGWVAYHFDGGDSEEWIRHTEQMLLEARQTLGPDHPATLAAARSRINVLRRIQRRFPEAHQLAHDTYDRCIKLLGEEHPITVSILSEVTALAWARGIQAAPLQRNVFELSKRGVGWDNAGTLFEQMRLGEALSQIGNLSEGEAVLRDAMERLHRLVGLEAPKSRWAMEWLAGNYLMQGRFPEAEALRSQVIEIDRRVLRPDSQFLFWHQQALANVYARQGKWKQSASLYRECLPASTRGGTDRYFAGLTVMGLAEDRDGAATFVTVSLDHFADWQNLAESIQLSRSLVLTFHLVPATEQQRVLSFLDRAVSQRTDAVEEKLIAGATATLREDWNAATEKLSPLVNNPDPAVASISSFFLARAQHGQGNTDAARAALANGQERLQRLIRRGDLGKDEVHPRQGWAGPASCILAFQEAQRVVEGRRILPEIDSNHLTVARQQWKPVRTLLDECNAAGRQKDWARAKSAFLAAQAHPEFTWESAADWDAHLRGKAAALFAFTDDGQAFAGLCETFLRPADPSQLEYADLAGYSSDFPTPELREKAVALARWGEVHISLAPEGEAGLRWREVVLGILQYRLGDYAAAVRNLTKAQAAYDLKVSGPAHAFAAMAEWKSGRSAEARQLMAKAEELFKEFLAGNPDDLGLSWDGAALFEVAINEARTVLSSTNKGNP